MVLRKSGIAVDLGKGPEMQICDLSKPEQSMLWRISGAMNFSTPAEFDKEFGDESLVKFCSTVLMRVQAARNSLHSAMSYVNGQEDRK